MLRSKVKRHKNVEADQDTSSLDFGRAVNQPETSDQLENSITLWGPGVQMEETPSTILSQSLHTWRKDNGQLPADKAAEELDKLYETLPAGALELTFQDMVPRNQSPDSKGQKNGQSQYQSKTIKEEDVGQVKRTGKEKKDNSDRLSISARIATLFSPPKIEYSPSNKGHRSHAELDKLVEKRRRKSKDSEQEGLYSASTTPAASFRRVSPLTSPNKLSPSPSFTDYMLRINRQSFERELTNSARFLDAYMDDIGGKPRIDENFPQQNLPADSLTHSLGKGVPDENTCSGCSSTNLFFMKTTCLICGKSFCISCRDTETKEALRGVRRCKKDCAAEVRDKEALINKRKKDRRRASGWWPINFVMCGRVKSVAEE